MVSRQEVWFLCHVIPELWYQKLYEDVYRLLSLSLLFIVITVIITCSLHTGALKNEMTSHFLNFEMFICFNDESCDLHFPISKFQKRKLTMNWSYLLLTLKENINEPHCCTGWHVLSSQQTCTGAYFTHLAAISTQLLRSTTVDIYSYFSTFFRKL